MSIFAPTSNYYGHSKILSDYCGMRLEGFPIGIQHGAYLTPTDCDVKFGCRNLLVWSRNYQDLITKRYPALKPVAVGAPFLYLLKGSIPFTINDPQGSIFFPQHSSHLIGSIVDHEKTAIALYKLDKKFHPITICMYYVDLNNGHDAAYKKYGFEIVSNGEHRLDKQFLLNFLSNVSEKRYALTNQYSSALLYCEYLGIRTAFFGETPEIDVHETYRSYLQEFTHGVDQIRSFFAIKDIDENSMEKESFVNKILGVEDMKTQDDLRSIIRAMKLSPHGIYLRLRAAIEPMRKNLFGKVSSTK